MTALALWASSAPREKLTYLYELAGLFSGFYEHYPTLTAEDNATKQSHLRMALLTARTLNQGQVHWVFRQ